MVTKEIAVAAKHGDIFHHVSRTNSDGTPLRVRVSGKCKVWKTRPESFKLPIKHGLYANGYIDNSNAAYWVEA